MNTLKVANPLLKKEHRFIYGKIRQQKSLGSDPTVIITTTVTHVVSQR